MFEFSFDRLRELQNNFSGKRIAVIGDLMIDHYFWGNINRISPEAPVPVVEIESKSVRLGGAANVANNISSLGVSPILFGVVGDDRDGRIIIETAIEQKMDHSGIVFDSSRPTTTKTRVIAHSQHVVRIDHEVKTDISSEVETKILKKLESMIDSIDAIILEDYNKGVLTKRLIQKILDLAYKHKIFSTVDPKFHNFFEYKRATVFKPNKKETEEAFGIKINDLASIQAAGKRMLKDLEAENILLTLSERGMMLFEKDGSITNFPTMARNVADVSGAGDTVIATLTAALAAGASIKEAAMLANYAGGIVCGEVGVNPIERDRLFETIHHWMHEE